jgi:hypothetical protein
MVNSLFILHFAWTMTSFFFFRYFCAVILQLMVLFSWRNNNPSEFLQLLAF